MESETELTQNAALKTLYQKTQASLMLDILSKLPKSQTHPLNTLRYKYFEQINLKSEIGLKMYLIMLVTNSLSNQKYTSSENKIRQLKLSKLVELLYLAFEIQDCILELGEIEDLKIKKEIEDANRICVLAGDFFMATASTQLAEIENQLVVKQISKGISDMSSGRAYQINQLIGLDQWLISNNLNFIQLIKKAIWSSLTLRTNTSRDTSASDFAPGEELISKDLIGQLQEVENIENRKLFTSEDCLETDIVIGTNFISNFILLNKLVDDLNNARNGIYSQNQVQFCIHRSSLSELERDEIYSKDLAQIEIPKYIWNSVEKTKSILIQNTHSSLDEFPENASKDILKHLVSLIDTSAA